MNGGPPESARQLAGDAGGETDTPQNTALLIDATTAAGRLRIGKRKLWSLTNSRAIPSRRIGRAVRYCPRELAAWIELDCPTEPGSADRVRKAVRR